MNESLKGFCVNETTIVYNSQKSGYLAKCWRLTQAQAQAQAEQKAKRLTLLCCGPLWVSHKGLVVSTKKKTVITNAVHYIYHIQWNGLQCRAELHSADHQEVCNATTRFC